VAAFIFDLDMTLVDSSAIAMWRRVGLWSHVRTNLAHVKPFPVGTPAPHELPARLKASGHAVAVVTSSPRWYAEALIRQFNIQADTLVAWDDTEQHKPDPAPILRALEQLGIEPNNACHIGDATIDVQASYHAGVPSIGAGWGVLNCEELSSAAPDVLLLTPSALLRLDELGRRGYFGEMLCRGVAPKAHRGSILPCGGSPERYALGRYFTTEDPRHAGSALSAHILTLKNVDDSAGPLGQALAAFVAQLDWTPDYIVPVPPKPSQGRNRFAAVLNAAEPLLPDDIEVALDGLQCVREIEGYKGMGALERASAIRGVFSCPWDWDGSKILLVDDVLTTGETIGEAGRVLLASRASEVRVVAFGKDQQTFARKECPACGRPMRVRTQRSTGDKFWGCSGYPQHCQNTERL